MGVVCVRITCRPGVVAPLIPSIPQGEREEATHSEQGEVTHGERDEADYVFPVPCSLFLVLAHCCRRKPQLRQRHLQRIQRLPDVVFFDEAEVADAEDLALELALSAGENDAVLVLH